MNLSLASLMIVATLAPTSAQLRGEIFKPIDEIFKPIDDPCDLSCETNYDCPRTCQQTSPYSLLKTCIASPAPAPIQTTSPQPTVCTCDNPSKIPDKCEVEILMDLMELLVLSDPKVIAQVTRAAFHDAGTFDQTATPQEGGANGCLLTDPAMRLEPENQFLDGPLNALQVIKDTWHGHAATCIKVSSADMLQFAIFFAVTRQKGPNHGILDLTKRDFIRTKFHWGRPDEQTCDPFTTMNLPAFETPAQTINGGSGGIVDRCGAGGKEINDKMILLNGFTAEEATVLIGAHTIGQIRGTFSSLGGPWVPNGHELATPNGPMFDNEFFDFLINAVAVPHSNDLNDFESNGPVPAPWDTLFPTWWKKVSPEHNHFDTDITLAFPPVASAHPDYSGFSLAFANDDAFFIKMFYLALDKMSKLGVTVPLHQAGACEDPCAESKGEIFVKDIVMRGEIATEDVVLMISKLGRASARSEDITRDLQVRRIKEIEELTKPQAGEIIFNDDSVREPPRD